MCLCVLCVSLLCVCVCVCACTRVCVPLVCGQGILGPYCAAYCGPAAHPFDMHGLPHATWLMLAWSSSSSSSREGPMCCACTKRMRTLMLLRAVLDPHCI